MSSIFSLERWANPSTVSRTARRAVRRLGIEPMESREMLSASALDMNSFHVSEGQTVVVAQRSEGGFISTRFSVADVMSNNQLLLHGADGGAVRVIFNNAAAYDADDAGNATEWLLLDSTDPLTSSFGIPLAAVFTDSGGLIPTAGEAPSEAGPLENDEGGQIPIASIQSELTSGESGLGRLPVRTLAIGRSSLQSNPSADLLAASVTSSEITGEWARAIAFEFVGDEGAELKRSARNGPSGVTQLSDQAIDGRIDPRLSLQAAQRGERGAGNDQPAAAMSHDATKQLDNTPSQNDLSEFSFGIPSFANDALTVAGGLAPQLAAAVEATRVMALAAAPAVTLGSVANAAVAEAFSEWSAEGLAARRLVAEERQWNSWGPAPLLLLLALERISAGNSRRAQGGGSPDAAPAAVRRPGRRTINHADHTV